MKTIKITTLFLILGLSISLFSSRSSSKAEEKEQVKVLYAKDIYPTDVCAIVSRRGFREDMPEAETYFENFNLTDDQLNILMDYVERIGALEGARKWYEENQ